MSLWVEIMSTILKLFNAQPGQPLHGAGLLAIGLALWRFNCGYKIVFGTVELKYASLKCSLFLMHKEGNSKFYIYTTSRKVVGVIQFLTGVGPLSRDSRIHHIRSAIARTPSLQFA